MNNLVSKGTSFLKEFQKFAVKGNVLDMAIGVVSGTAFGKIVSSLVSDIIMPLIGLVAGNVDLKKLSVTLCEKTDTSDAVVMSYGAFLQNVFDFILIAFSIFIAIKAVIALKKKVIKEENEANAAAPAPVTPEDIQLLREIRDLLKK